MNEDGSEEKASSQVSKQYLLEDNLGWQENMVSWILTDDPIHRETPPWDGTFSDGHRECLHNR